MQIIKKLWKYKKKNRYYILLTLLLLFLNPFLFSMNPDWLLPKSATPHSPIIINGNSEMDAFFFGNISDGTSWENAYILEDLEFTPSWTAIEIHDTDRYLIIKNCYFTGAGSGYGIDFDNVTNVNVTHCNFGNFHFGIWADEYSHHNYYQYNNFTHSEYGIYLIYEYNSTIASNRMTDTETDGLHMYESDNNTIYNNNVYDNKEYGIRLSVCNDNNLTLNNASHNKYGIVLSSSMNNTLVDNEIQENSQYGVGVHYSHNNTFRDNELELDEFYLDYSYDNDIDSSNLVNGLPVLLVESQSSINFNGLTNLGQLILVDCNFCTISDSEFLSSAGVFLSESSNNNILNVNVTSSTFGGIHLSRSNDILISDCTLESCYYGIYVSISDRVNINSSNVTNSDADGIRIGSSDFTSIFYNNVSLNSVDGVSLGSAVNTTLHGNYVSQNQVCGFDIEGSTNTTARWNNSTENAIGVRLDSASETDVLWNNLSKNDVWGIASYYSDNLRLIGNNLSYNHDNGAYLATTDNISIQDNIISHNWDTGLFLQSAENCSITQNQIFENYDSGIELYGRCNHNKIWKNVVYNNNPHNLYENGAVKIRVNIENANTTIWMNNFINNGDNGAVDNGPENIWDNGTHGNFWSNFIEKYPDANKIGVVWDTEYDIYGDAASSDRYPLVNPLVNGEIVYTAFFVSNVTNILTADYVQFTELTTGGVTPYSFDWDFGDGTAHSTDPNPVHQYNSEGEFEVTLTVTDDDENVAVSSSNITVGLDLFPVASFTASDILTLTHEPIYFTDTSTGGNLPLHYEWNFDDGTPNSTMQNPWHEWTTAGAYDVVLTVNDTDGDISIYSMEITIEEDIPPVSSFTVNATTITEGEWIQFTFTGDEGNEPTTFEWNFGDGFFSEERNPIHQYTASGSYSVQLTVYNRYGSMDMTSLEITVNALEPERPKIPGYSIEWIALVALVVIGTIFWLQLKRIKSY